MPVTACDALVVDACGVRTGKAESLGSSASFVGKRTEPNARYEFRDDRAFVAAVMNTNR